MDIDLSILEPVERAVLSLRSLYEREGYRIFHMSRFEEYSLYQENRPFLPSGQIITFTDLDGRLLALKPDVTLSIAKNARPSAGAPEKYYYCENVYRPGHEGRAFEEINQTGLECIGEVGRAQELEVLSLALESLSIAGSGPVLALSHMGFVTGVMDGAGLPRELRGLALGFIRSKNAHGLLELVKSAGGCENEADVLLALTALSGTSEEVAARSRDLNMGETARAALTELFEVCCELEKGRPAGEVTIDFSVLNDVDYYNGLVFRGYLAGCPRAVLKGGRYDPLADKFSSGARAIGFALYLNELNRPISNGGESVSLNVALPKGRLGDKVCALLERAGYGLNWNAADSRRLVLESERAGVRCFLVKPGDVAAYVAHGAADVGIAGLDVLKESGEQVYELLDTALGRCRMCVAAPVGFRDDRSKTLRVATKYGGIAREYYASQGREIDIIELGGSIELAPILGLCDVIVDIVETGATLRDNGLEVVAEFMDISARLIVNEANFHFKREAIERLAQKLSEVTNDKDN